MSRQRARAVGEGIRLPQQTAGQAVLAARAERPRVGGPGADGVDQVLAGGHDGALHAAARLVARRRVRVA